MNTYSLNLMAYLKNRGFDLEIKTDNGNVIYATFEPTDEALAAMNNYKKDKELHSFLQTYNELRKNIKTLRTSN